MKTNIYKYLLLIAGILITGIGKTQSANNNIVPFKEIHRRQSTDNFTAWEIKKEELQITSTQAPLPDITGQQPKKEDKYRKKKKNRL